MKAYVADTGLLAGLIEPSAGGGRVAGFQLGRQDEAVRRHFGNSPAAGQSKERRDAVPSSRPTAPRTRKPALSSEEMSRVKHCSPVVAVLLAFAGSKSYVVTFGSNAHDSG